MRSREQTRQRAITQQINLEPLQNIEIQQKYPWLLALMPRKTMFAL